MTARTPITERGAALLALISVAMTNADAPFLMLTQDEGLDLITAGQAEANPEISNADDGTVAVRLTDAGTAALAAANAPAGAAAAPAAAAVKPTFEIEKGVAMPTNTVRNGGGRESSYPFDQLEVGDSFHVPKTAENPNPAVRLASSVSGARVKYSEAVNNDDGTPKTETVKVPVYQKDADGKTFSKDAEGKRIKTGEQDAVKPVTKQTRDFSVKTVAATDPKGEGARVWRTL